MLLQILSCPDTVSVWECIYNDNWLAEIFGGLFTSGMFLLGLYSLRPRFKLSKEIAKIQRDGKTYFQVKVINESWFSAIDVNLELLLVKPDSAPGGRNLKSKPIPLISDQKWVVPGKTVPWNKDANFLRGMLVTTETDIEALWTDRAAYLVFRVIAKHGVSGFPKTVREQYNDKDTVIIPGNFKWGDTVEIKKST